MITAALEFTLWLLCGSLAFIVAMAALGYVVGVLASQYRGG